MQHLSSSMLRSVSKSLYLSLSLCPSRVWSSRWKGQSEWIRRSERRFHWRACFLCVGLFFRCLKLFFLLPPRPSFPLWAPFTHFSRKNTPQREGERKQGRITIRKSSREEVFVRDRSGRSFIPHTQTRNIQQMPGHLEAREREQFTHTHTHRSECCTFNMCLCKASIF